MLVIDASVVRIQVHQRAPFRSIQAFLSLIKTTGGLLRNRLSSWFAVGFATEKKDHVLGSLALINVSCRVAIPQQV